MTDEPQGDHPQDGRPRAIVHLDLDAFLAGVEVLEDESRSGKPLAVGGRPEERGVVSTASYEACKFGVGLFPPSGQLSLW